MDSRTGELITARQTTNGVFIWETPNPLYFKITRHLIHPFNRPFHIIDVQIRFNHNLRKALGIHKCFLNFRVWTTLRPQTGRFLRVFRTQVLKYLNNLGVISINLVIRAVAHVLYSVLLNTIDVTESHEIKFDIY
ncbi:replication enhancement protein [Okra yellow crinkle virus]|uniref:Replication enhancer n=1 Tax=Okra yellow crinkle virus TaxID=401040 RepID=Q06F30_9GEMI|nr:replication enhancement protein [Okra yellow crinkle virus]ABS29527.1 C3 [Okra yellow crinkle virus-[Mali]]ABS29533.1 C3 [Okra leaf curl virus-[Mali]]ABI35962.1 replication enhancement protein [Okra yellow crinkle virus]ABI83653.1 replication enhancement protein [Okra yellow crinkle virus]ANZ02078.1 replication enhancer protein [Okra yellow crinkle virus]